MRSPILVVMVVVLLAGGALPAFGAWSDTQRLSALSTDGTGAWTVRLIARSFPTAPGTTGATAEAVPTRTDPHQKARTTMSHLMGMSVRGPAVAAILIISGLGTAPAVSAEDGASTCGGFEATIVGTADHDRLLGTPGRDVIVGRGGADVIRGRGGDDVICGESDAERGRAMGGIVGGDTIFAGPGDDLVLGGPDHDTLHGGAGRDRLWGGPGDDELQPGPGRDRVHGNEGLDVAGYEDADGPVRVDLTIDVATGEGRDRLWSIERARGSDFADVLIGDAGRNQLYGLGGADRLYGRDGRDGLSGGKGDDRLDGGPDRDSLVGGPGQDTCLDGPVTYQCES